MNRRELLCKLAVSGLGGGISTGVGGRCGAADGTPAASPSPGYRKRYGYTTYVTRRFASSGTAVETPVNLFAGVMLFEDAAKASAGLKVLAAETVAGYRSEYNGDLRPSATRTAETVDDEVKAFEAFFPVPDPEGYPDDRVHLGVLLSRRGAVVREYSVSVWRGDPIRTILDVHEKVAGRRLGGVATPGVPVDYLPKDGAWYLLPTLADVSPGMLPVGDEEL